MKAVELLRSRAGVEAGADIQLTKRIPSAAGLGGGSSDAAAALVAANLCWNIGYSQQRLLELAAELGSDVPFFLRRGAAMCRGRGELLEPLHAPRGLHFVIVRPPEGLSTAEVYRRCRPAEDGTDRRDSAALAAALHAGDLRRIAAGMFNRLQVAAEQMSPWVARLAAWFAELNLVGHQLTGSGSGYFGICRSARHARRAAARLSSRGAGSAFAVTGL